MKNPDIILLKILGVVSLWLLNIGFFLPWVVKFASTILLVGVFILTVISIYITMKYLLKLYKDYNVQ